jgi:hypothetical protein
LRETRHQQKNAGQKNENRFCGGLAISRKMPGRKMKTAFAGDSPSAEKCRAEK